MNKDLKSLSRKELEKLLNDVKKALAAAASRDRRDAHKAAVKAAAEYGFSLSELKDDAPEKTKPVKAAKKKPAKPSKPKYANPADPSQTWTGKGRQPNWFRAEVETGTVPSDLEI